MFGNFNLNAGLSQLQDLGGRFQKIREDLEQNIESSLRTNIAPSASGDEADGSGAAVDGTVAFGEWEGYSLTTPATPAQPGSEKPQDYDQQGSGSKPSPPLPQPAHAESLLRTTLSAGNNDVAEQQLQATVTADPTPQQAEATCLSAEESTAPDNAQEAGSVSREQPDSNDAQNEDLSATMQSTEPPSDIDQLGNNEHSGSAESSSQEASTLLEPQPDSNGSVQWSAADDSLQQEQGSAGASEALHLQSTAGSEAGHVQTGSSAAEQTQPAQDAAQQQQEQQDQQLPVPDQEQQLQEQQLPVSDIYISSQVDHSSRNSLPDSILSAADSKQQAASTNGNAAVASHSDTDAEDVNGNMQETLQTPSHQQAPSQQSSQDNNEQQAGIPDMVEEQSEMERMGKEAVWDMVQQLQAGLQAREKQLERQGQQLANMQEVQEQLQAKNEELVTKAAKVSEEDMAAVQEECERRLGAAERKVYALVKERDALRRGSDKLSSAHDLLKEKDSIIAQVMEEGERLSIKQSNMESIIKKLRAQVKDLEASHIQTAAKLAAEEAKVEAATQARQKAEAAAASALQQHKAEIEQQKQHSGDRLKEAQKSQAAAEEKAAASAKEGLGRRVKEAEASAQALVETVEELRLTLERQRASAELREEGLQREVRDLEQRCQAAEARHQDLAANIPEATRPLLRQLEAMQASASANAQAWAAAEANLTARLNDFESAAAGAGEREKRAWEKLQASNTRMAATIAALDTLKAELGDANAEVERAQQAQRAATARSSKAEEQLSQARQAESTAHQRQIHVEHTLGEQLATEQAQSLEASLAAEERIQALEQRLAAQQEGSAVDQAAAGDPPAMAAPGYRWQLVRGNDRASSGQINAVTTTLESSAASDKGSDTSYEPGPSQHSRSHTGTAGELDRLRTTLKQKEDQIFSLQSQLTNIEATRDSLAEEVIAAAGSEEAARSALADAASAQQEHRQAQQQLMACTEMLGEKEERLEELRADLQDVKQLYKDQIEFMVEQLAHVNLQQHGHIAPQEQTLENQESS